jgi:hypothetical protein
MNKKDELIQSYQRFIKWVLRHTPEIEESERGRDYLFEIDQREKAIQHQEPDKTESESDCNHVIGANDNSGICIKCGKKVCEIINNDLCSQ